MFSGPNKKLLVRVAAIVGLFIAGLIHLADLDQILITPAENRGPIMSGVVEVLNFLWWFIGSAYFLGFVFAIFLVVVLNLQPVIARIFKGGNNQKKAMQTPGIEFFPERRLLDEHDSLETIVKASESFEAFNVVGIKLTNNISNFERYIKKLLLPDPDSRSLLNLEATTDRKGNFVPFIKTSTRSALNKNVPVRWYTEFVGYSLIIVDRHKDSGWVHVEFVLPHSEHLDRPSIRIKKNEQPKAFNHFVSTFDAMWDAAKTPNLD